MAQRKSRVVVLFGGRSGEHQVSLASARSVMQALDPDRYEVIPVGIAPDGRWLTSGDPMAQLTSGAESVDEDTLALTPGGGRDLVPGTSRGRFPEADVVFPVLHGTFGEDGTVQGLLELANLPYVGAGVLGSALGMDKIAQKQVLIANGIPVVDYLALLRSTWQADPHGALDQIEQQFGYPVFVKPANMGSSVGVSKAHDRQELVSSLTLAARFDRRILIEEAVNVREIECSVLGNDAPIASVLGEVRPAQEFYSYAAKYVDNDSDLLIPAPLPEATAAEIQRLAILAFQAIDCAGMARVDFFVSKDDGSIYLNELNTIPGFTAISMYPKLWEASGLPYRRLVDRLIELAIERFDERQHTETQYGFDH